MKTIVTFVLIAIASAMSGWAATAADYWETIGALGYCSYTTRNLSDSLHVELEQPTLAYVNLTSKYGIPYTKTSNFKDWIEYYDPATDQYFKKRVRINVQGQYSTTFKKRGMSMEFCEDEWLCDSVPEIDFEGWVKQDAFHLKAFYADWLRGSCIVGYQIFDEMELNMPEEVNRIWKRAGVDAKKNARCYPDGFPCALYLNGEFYGLYTWQLKKHRRNTGQSKKNPRHIHLDGNMGETNFWNDNIRWTAFEIRNPKGLTTTEGEPYDTDNPSEIADGEVKQSIQALSRRCGELKTMRERGASSEQIRDSIAAHFDVESMVNYLVFSTVTNNYDGYTKNWQWLTYDGDKWFVAPYDLDCTFGNYHVGTFLFPPQYSYVDSDYTFDLSRRGIATWFWDYYFEEISKRYAELRDAGIIDPAHISQLLHAWHDRIGDAQYEAEWRAWPDCLCIGETVTNEGWEAVERWENYYHVAEWKEATTYQCGDSCRLGERIWIATAAVTGVKPYSQLGYTDSLERLDNWIGRRIALEDGYFGYVPGSAIRTINAERGIANTQTGYDLWGRRVEGLASGVLIQGGRKIIIRQ